jgi:hypothetical protein
MKHTQIATAVTGTLAVKVPEVARGRVVGAGIGIPLLSGEVTGGEEVRGRVGGAGVGIRLLSGEVTGGEEVSEGVLPEPGACRLNSNSPVPSLSALCTATR